MCEEQTKKQPEAFLTEVLLRPPGQAGPGDMDPHGRERKSVLGSLASCAATPLVAFLALYIAVCVCV